MEINKYSPNAAENQQTEKLIKKLEEYSERKKVEVKKQTAEEYFLMLLHKGIEARKAGNYGIAAALILRSNDIEIIVFGKNTVFSDQNPHGHAEMNAVKNAVESIKSRETMQALMKSGDMIIRESRLESEEVLLITTLEPCPMCMVGSIINANVNQVLIGVPDEFAGASQEDRLKSLAPLWANTAEKQGIKVNFAQGDDSQQTDTYLDDDMRKNLNDLFFQTKQRLDEKLESEGFLNLLDLVIMLIK